MLMKLDGIKDKIDESQAIPINTTRVKILGSSL